MKNFIFKLFLTISIFFAILSCGNTKRYVDTRVGAMKAEEMVLNARQLDSLCIADTLVNNLNNWVKSTYYDYETKNKTDKYVYIKHVNEPCESVYILIPQDTLYKITKRIIVK